MAAVDPEQAFGGRGVTRGQGGTSAPGRSIYGATNWGQNVTKCHISEDAKSHQDHQRSLSEQFRTLVTFYGGTSASSNQCHMWFEWKLRDFLQKSLDSHLEVDVVPNN